MDAEHARSFQPLQTPRTSTVTAIRVIKSSDKSSKKFSNPFSFTMKYTDLTLKMGVIALVALMLTLQLADARRESKCLLAGYPFTFGGLVTTAVYGYSIVASAGEVDGIGKDAALCVAHPVLDCVELANFTHWSELDITCTAIGSAGIEPASYSADVLQSNCNCTLGQAAHCGLPASTPGSTAERRSLSDSPIIPTGDTPPLMPDPFAPPGSDGIEPTLRGAGKALRAKLEAIILGAIGAMPYVNTLDDLEQHLEGDSVSPVITRSSVASHTANARGLHAADIEVELKERKAVIPPTYLMARNEMLTFTGVGSSASEQSATTDSTCTEADTTETTSITSTLHVTSTITEQLTAVVFASSDVSILPLSGASSLTGSDIAQAVQLTVVEASGATDPVQTNNLAAAAGDTTTSATCASAVTSLVTVTATVGSTAVPDAATTASSTVMTTPSSATTSDATTTQSSASSSSLATLTSTETATMTITLVGESTASSVGSSAGSTTSTSAYCFPTNEGPDAAPCSLTSTAPANSSAATVPAAGITASSASDGAYGVMNTTVATLVTLPTLQPGSTSTYCYDATRGAMGVCATPAAASATIAAGPANAAGANAPIAAIVAFLVAALL